MSRPAKMHCWRADRCGACGPAGPAERSKRGIYGSRTPEGVAKVRRESINAVININQGSAGIGESRSAHVGLKKKMM